MTYEVERISLVMMTDMRFCARALCDVLFIGDVAKDLM